MHSFMIINLINLFLNIKEKNKIYNNMKQYTKDQKQKQKETSFEHASLDD